MLLGWSPAHLHAAQPLPDRQEGLFSCEVIHDDDTIGLSEELLGDTMIPAIEGPQVRGAQPSLQSRPLAPLGEWGRQCYIRDGSSPLLPGCVPQLQGHLRVTHTYHLHTVINACKVDQACYFQIRT